MKNNQLTGMLAGLLLLSTLFSAAMIYKYNSSMRKWQRLQPQVGEVTKASSIMQAILNDTIEYSQNTKNPDMARLLQSLGNGTKPAAKAPTK